MFTKYILPLLAIAGMTFAIITVYNSRYAPQNVPTDVPPPSRPKQMKSIAGAGIVEARKENIPIGTNIPGVVTEVYVKKGDQVQKGDSLFRIDDRDYKARLLMAEAELAAAEAQLHKLIAAPRPEDVPPARAAVEEARAKLDDAEAAMGRTERLYQRQMAPAQDYDKDRFTYYAARAALARAQADLERILAGTWKEDIDVARAAVQQAKSRVESAKIDLERLTVRAMADGEVLQLNVRLGQFAGMVFKEPMIILGDVKRLHVRVDIDESDLPFFEKEAEAIATLKGRPGARFEGLKLVYIEPYVVPKTSLTGSNSERVDTRVLQVIYELPDKRPVDLYVGEQMDVYMKAAAKPEGITLDTSRIGLPFEDDDPTPKARVASPHP
jgi:multidrug resistance efflux pump